MATVVLMLAVGFAVPMLIANTEIGQGLDDLLARIETGAIPATATPGALTSARFSRCGSGVRHTCVVDGDTIWLEGMNIRIADFNTPEVGQPECAAEAALGARATERLTGLLNAGPFELRRADRDADQYGRKLRTIHRDGRSIGDVMVAEGLAHRWEGFRRSWC
jgi:endonuclease YncB( thermonuclease family)